MEITQQLGNTIANRLKELGIDNTDVVFERPADMSHGDYATNVAMQHAKELGKNPRELAEEIVSNIEESDLFLRPEVAGPGFINFRLKDNYFQKEISEIDETIGKSHVYSGKKILVEHSSPNLFKPFHIGHVMNNTIGESIVRLAQFSGAGVIKTSFPSDVSLGIAKAVWALLQDGVEKFDAFSTISEKLSYMGDCYVEGNKAFEENEEAQKEIKSINQKIYAKTPGPEWNAYKKGYDVNLEYFKNETKRLGSEFDEFIFESVAGNRGLEIVQANTPGVFEVSDGAIIFDGEKRGLHTRVFVSGEGRPTYEAKDIGLFDIKFSKWNPDLSILITDVEQGPYYKVVLEAAGEINKDWKEKTIHQKHGRMTFKGKKMSSRLGGVPLASDVLELVGSEVKERMQDATDASKVDVVAIAALKFSILRVMAGKNMDFDPETSLSFEGDSGPYLQYTYARCNSILEKTKELGFTMEAKPSGEWKAQDLEKIICRFGEEVEKSIKTWEPHHVAGYLLTLAREFNSWYGNTKILDGSNENLSWNLWLVQSTMHVLKNGLYCLGIETVEKM